MPPTLLARADEVIEGRDPTTDAQTRIDLSSLRRMERRRLRCARRWCRGRPHHEGAAVPVGQSWMWTLAFGYHEDRTPTHGYAATREAALVAFGRSWRRE